MKGQAHNPPARLFKLAHSYFTGRTSTHKPNGPKECARRVEQRSRLSLKAAHSMGWVH